MKLSDFDYELPRELIAQYPAEKRDASRLLILDRQNEEITSGLFKEIVSYLKPGDLLVLNDTRVIKARLIGKRSSGGRAEVFLLEHLESNDYEVLLRPAKKIKKGDRIWFSEDDLYAEAMEDKGAFRVVRFMGSGNVRERLEEMGEIPLPPYLKRKPTKEDDNRYQTVYARTSGATAAPTAGLHFTTNILEELERKGVKIATLTLHVSYGTFAPVKVENIEEHKMHTEQFILDEVCASIVNETKRQGGRVFAVGTTSCRVLESCAQEAGKVRAKKGKTDLFIYPSYKFKIVDALLTNFHLPKSTLLLLVSAFAGKDLIFKAYREAIAERYRFFSYGDAMLIL